MALVNVFLVLFCSAHLCIIAADRQEEKQREWPLLYYPMFSRLKDWSFGKNVLVGVPAGPGGGERTLLASRYLRPIGTRDFHRIVQEANRRTDGPAFLEATLRDIHSRYEGRRLRGEHDGPPLKALRIYREEWRTAPGFVPPGPEARMLLAELRPR